MTLAFERWFSFAFVLIVGVVSAGCSAVISPDLGRLGTDGGPGSDSNVVAIDSGRIGVDTGQIGVDTGQIGVDTGAGCTPLQVDCGGVCVDFATDAMHCGSCTNACAVGMMCNGGRCGGVCAPGDPTCVGFGNPVDCGPSHAVCVTGQLCVGGACVCRPPLTPLGGACIDLATDPQNCGTPGMVCADACTGGMCVGACPDGTRDCDGACVRTQSDTLNCGACGNACSARQICQGGDCRDVTPARGCTSCPCADCGGGRRCCTLPRLMIPYCLDADVCP